MAGPLARVAPSIRARTRVWRWIYDTAHHDLGDHGTAFMNYGYAPVSEPDTPLELDLEAAPDRFGIRLYDKVAGAADLTGGARRKGMIERRVAVGFRARAREFSAVASSRIYREYACGDATYLRFVLLKGRASPTPAR